MFKHSYFNISILIILIFHMIVINNIIPKNTYTRDVNAVLQYKIKDNPPREAVYIEIKKGVINIYDDTLYTRSTKVDYKIPIFSDKKIALASISTTNSSGSDKYGLKISRHDMDETTIIFDSRIQREKWATIINEFDSKEYGKKSDGSVVLNDIQIEIKKYLEKAKIEENKIYGTDTSPIEIKKATAKLLKLRGNLDTQIKKYENPNTLDSILKGDILNVSDIVSCDCSLGNLRTLVMYLNGIVPSLIVIIFVIRYFNKTSVDSFVYKKIAGISGQEFTSEFLELILSSFMSFMYISLFIAATCYHFYLLSKCRCSVPTKSQKGYSLFFMFFFPILILLEIGYKLFIE